MADRIIRMMVRLPHAMTIPQLDGERNIGESLYERSFVNLGD